MEVENQLAGMGLTVSEPNPSIGNFVPAVRVGNLLFVSGNLPRLEDGSMVAAGKLGRDVSIEEGYEAARQCAVNCLASAREHHRRPRQGSASRQAAGHGRLRSRIRSAAGGGKRRLRPVGGTLRRKRPPRPIRCGHGRPAARRTRRSRNDPRSLRLIRRRDTIRKKRRGE